MRQLGSGRRPGALFPAVRLGLRLAAGRRELRANAAGRADARVSSCEPLGFDRLDGWSDDDPSDALVAFRRSCGDPGGATARPNPMAPDPPFGQVGDWLPACAAADARRRSSARPVRARRFFETWFQPYRVRDRRQSRAVCSPATTSRCCMAPAPCTRPYTRAALSRRPRSAAHRPRPVQSGAGRLTRSTAASRTASSCPTTRAPRSTAARWRGAASSCSGSTIRSTKFFLQVQGSGPGASGRRLGGPGRLRGQNGQPYRAIGRDLIEIGALDPGRCSLQTHPCLAARAPAGRGHDHGAQPLLHLLPGASGAFARRRAARRRRACRSRPAARSPSIRAYIPLGAPVWLDTSGASWPEGEGPLRRLLIAQDSWRRDRGVVRGDVFWGAGERAETIAGA